MQSILNARTLIADTYSAERLRSILLKHVGDTGSDLPDSYRHIAITRLFMMRVENAVTLKREPDRLVPCSR